TGPVIALASAGDKAKAANLMRTGVDPLLSGLLQEMVPAGVRLDREITEGVEGLHVQARQASLYMGLMTAAGVTVALLIGFMIAQFGVARPVA
ncbi:hypothetical protein, partial [Rhodoplanes serenus]|uniref:hypothetical protein n=1 Tax=Rhodoplanes serenus TaxID=200615 RepID=UPI001AECCEA0